MGRGPREMERDAGNGGMMGRVVKLSAVMKKEGGRRTLWGDVLTAGSGLVEATIWHL